MLLGSGNVPKAKRRELVKLLERMCTFDGARYTFKLTHDLVNPFESVISGRYGPIENTRCQILKIMGN
jgi:hypothetical protein